MNGLRVLLLLIGTIAANAQVSINAEPSKVATIPHVIELSVISNNTVCVHSQNWELEHILSNGGLMIDHPGIDVSTGRMTATSIGATNVMIRIGEAFAWGGYFSDRETYKLLKISDGVLFFEHSTVGGHSRKQDRIQTNMVQPYKTQISETQPSAPANGAAPRR